MPRPLDIRTTLANQINARGFTLTEVARGTGISYTHLKHAAAGRRPLSLHNLQLVARFIGVPTTSLYRVPVVKDLTHANG